MKKHGEKWTENEIEKLKELYPKYGAKYLEKIFDRKESAVREKARRLNIKYKKIKKIYLEENLKPIVKSSKTLRECLDKMKLRTAGGNYDVFIGRPSKWGNPYTHLKGKTKAKYVVETRKEAVENYRDYVLNNPELMASLPELKDKILGCFCKPLECHGDILAELVEKHYKDE